MKADEFGPSTTCSIPNGKVNRHPRPAVGGRRHLDLAFFYEPKAKIFSASWQAKSFCCRRTEECSATISPKDAWH